MAADTGAVLDALPAESFAVAKGHLYIYRGAMDSILQMS